ncbi:MAG: hypothetical protein ACRDY6_21690 [Acidimicrobiia bacterium]
MARARPSFRRPRSRAANGTTVGQAKEAIETGRKLEDLPATADAAKRGELSPQQAAAITDAASADPDAQERLLETSKSGSLGELRDECARTKANACDVEARRRRIHERRCLSTWTDADGVGSLQLRDNPEVVAAIMARVAPVRDEIFQEARAEGRREPLEAYAADALHQLVCGDTPATKAATKILARVDLAALLRGYPVGDETCELAGYGPVAVSALRDLIDTGDPFLAAVVTKDTEVVGVAHLGRRPTAHQRSALEWLYPTCAAEGCNALTFLEFDHREDWSKTHRTVFDLLDRLCSHHHDRKTRDGWALVHGRGKRAFVSPDDPRHSRHAKATTGTRRYRPTRRRLTDRTTLRSALLGGVAAPAWCLSTCKQQIHGTQAFKHVIELGVRAAVSDSSAASRASTKRRRCSR